jgi:HlyD family secretion protein
MLQERDLIKLSLAKHISRRKVKFFGLAMIGLSVIGIPSFLGWQAYTSSQRSLANSKNLATVKRGSIDIRISATGTIRPFNQVKISPKFTGLVRTLYVQQGDKVKKGDVLAEMDDSNLLGQVQAASAAYESAKANFEKMTHGNRPQEVADAQSQFAKNEHMVRSATVALSRCQADLKSLEAQVVRDTTNAKRLVALAKQGAVSDQDGLNAETQAEVTRNMLTKVQQEYRQAEATLAQAKADLESSRQRMNMSREGFRKEDIKAAHAAMVQAEGTMRFLKSQLNDTKIRAPFDGVITQKYTDHGAIVTPTTASTTNSATSSSIVSLAGRLEMVAAVAETDINNVQPGQKVEIMASAYPEKVFHGHVTLIAPEAVVNQNVTTFEVHAAIDDDPQRKLMSGMNVNVEFIAGKKDNVLLIPTVAVVSKKAKVGVFVPDKSNNPEFKPITIGTGSDTETVVLKGLEEGDKLFLGLTKEQLAEEGYNDKNMGGSGGKPQIPRGFRNKL